ncbi:30S ribosomal protein S13 [Chlamydia gallinacea]|uniref:Small ribosomal subunit protein uS13 n=2 Tax=Chlamydia gallinacea TaxID=1457153 RepID=A0A173DZ53_9CHLA|nr:30S ribosomal protein S13 [Chlamydia gallinacea]EYE60510.1 30S ribosomal protein S13 [Bacteroides fragilis str. S6L5]ANG66183.1 30S ribosomal protein S13 [Chlamydia gallinacea 08-1274/3]AQT77603.1 30S ribosomal protein S13 [Chlamydia gallinacea]MBX6680619.1 30S ribosomal protein S13 [Chlamydia gallinacea]MBX6687898.1 30S ribosomal protein S13 [Chlamydia gallinacea]
MPRIIGIDIPAKKKLKISLRYIYGIGPALSEEIIAKLQLNPEARAAELTEEEIGRLNSLLQTEYVVEGDLRRRVQSDIKRLIAIHAYRGQRHRLSLPVRGQRTKTNSRTRKGKRKTVAGKKK